jgi:ParB-like chromosome segregation protein Spo0J
MKIKQVEIEKLIPYVNNSRTHDDAQVAQIAASIKEFGWTNPILTDGDNGIIAGHGRLMAARKLGMTTVPVIELEGMTEAQKKAYVIADNKLALNAGWDLEVLKLELEALVDDGFNVELTGFSLDELNDLSYGDESDVLDDMPNLASGDKEPFQQKTFTLHDEQVSIVDDAIMKARTNPIVDTGLNENSNGNALALICEQWLKNNG